MTMATPSRTLSLSSRSRDKKEAVTAPTLEMKNMSMNANKLGEESHVLLTPAMETFDDSPEPLFEYPQNELEGSSPSIMEGKGNLILKWRRKMEGSICQGLSFVD